MKQSAENMDCFAGSAQAGTWASPLVHTCFNNHLGNVLATVSDFKEFDVANNRFEAKVKTAQEYFPFGSLQPGRYWNSDQYRFGFQGQEADNEIKGIGNSINYAYRVHDPRLGRFLSIDPLSAKYPFYSPYAFSGNRVIDMVELEGLEPADPPTEDGAIAQASVQGSDSDKEFSWMGWGGEWFGSTAQAAEVSSTSWNWDDYGAQLYFNDVLYRSLMNSDRPDELKSQIFMSRYRFGYGEITRGVQTIIGVGITAPLIFAGGLATATVTASWGMRVGSVVFDYSTQVVSNKISGDSWEDALLNNVNLTSLGTSFLFARPTLGNYMCSGLLSTSFQYKFSGSKTIANGLVQADEVAYNTAINMGFGMMKIGAGYVNTVFNRSTMPIFNLLEPGSDVTYKLAFQMFKVKAITEGFKFSFGVTNNYLSK